MHSGARVTYGIGATGSCCGLRRSHHSEEQSVAADLFALDAEEFMAPLRKRLAGCSQAKRRGQKRRAGTIEHDVPGTWQERGFAADMLCVIAK
jgi:hypothetical protein